MENSKVRTALTVLGVIILVILMASVIYGLIKSLSNDSSDDNNSNNDTAVEETVEENDLKLEEDAKTGEVTFFARGPIVAREDHYEVKVTINRDRRSIAVYKGYQKTPIEQGSFDNDLEAFTQFLYAAKRAGLFINNGSDTDKEGYCYRGEIRTYTTTGFSDNNDTWSSSCDGAGTLTNDKFLLRLIKDQFPDYGKFVDQI